MITIAANGSVSVAVTDPTPYENGEDVVVGIKNNSPTPAASLTATVTGTGSSVSTAPTLGEWGMILLGTLLIGCAAVLMGRKANQTV